MERKSRVPRLFIIQIVIVVLIAVLVHSLWELQIVDGKKYAEEFELKTARIIKEGNTRGNIYDSNGKVLAYNKLVYTVGIRILIFKMLFLPHVFGIFEK